MLLKRLGRKEKCFSVDKDRAKKPTLIMDLASWWSFRGEVFDLILSTWVIEHLVNPQNFYSEAFRVLRDRGIMVCAVPFIQRKHGSPHDYYRFTDMALLHLAHSTGFKHVEIRPVGDTPFICCASLLWPFFYLPLVGWIVYFMAWILDILLEVFSSLLGKKGEVVHSFPINYIIIAMK